MITSVELCAGAGGQALGLEQAGFHHEALFENDFHACNTLRLNRPNWYVEEHDLFQQYDFKKYSGVDLLAGGLPCPPFSVAGKQLGKNDERNLFDIGVNIVDEIRPKAVMFENVKGMLGKSFSDYRDWIDVRLRKMNYRSEWKLLNSCDFGLAQLRPRMILIALKKEHLSDFAWPEAKAHNKTVSTEISDLMCQNNWSGFSDWYEKANKIGPTIVGGSKKHGGPDLGPTRARLAWSELGINGGSIAEEAPNIDFNGMPRLTLRMVARLQGFPDDWGFWGKKTHAYRQIGNAFPPPVAYALGKSIAHALGHSDSKVKRAI